ncbi:uncharacterized protein B0H18DRAFT_1121519 [Fomitopsis serialis]|uniref:uncharacterized protein n=1 Tax=Fomitopsis serialis TaxID=139415 RepID=UPI0020075198|nr:uncharacterized protein B0H18DRAFT_1121519 [Neoantrodia serialis]KAH9921102.1 hypothetical protein B0H18DRAFT_1121519 [Neoantrodia serialis]
MHKAVYAAEQIMGPGRRLYHKPLEHDQEPYCKNCHMKLFGTRTLGMQNLPNRDEVPLTSPPISPTRGGFSPTRPGFSPTRAASPPARSPVAPPLPARRHATGGGSLSDRSAFPTPSSVPPVLRPTRALSPTRTPTYRSPALEGVVDVDEEDTQTAQDGVGAEERQASYAGSTATHTGRGQGGLPRTRRKWVMPDIDGEPASIGVASPAGRARSPDTVPRMTGTVPLVPTSTGTRYGMALGGRMAPTMTGAGAGTGRPWGLGGSNPLCGKCGKTVYFAEQVRAIGKTYHKGCLRCSECNTHLDSTRLTERDGNPYCIGATRRGVGMPCWARRAGKSSFIRTDPFM